MFFMFFREVMLVMAIVFLGEQTAVALTKAEAQECVNQGINTFLAGQSLSNMVDAAYMIEREKISVTKERLAELVNKRARDNLGYYRKVSANVVGQPQAKKGNFFLVAGRVTGEETEKLDPVIWKDFNYNYILWIRKDEDEHCLIGVFAIEEVFRLATWVKANL